MDDHMQKYLDKHCADVIIYGHTHMPYVSEHRVNTGTFVEIATYVTETAGEFQLHNLDQGT